MPARVGRCRKRVGVDVVTALRNRFETRGTVVPTHDPTRFVLWLPGGPVRRMPQSLSIESSLCAGEACSGL